MNLSCSSFLFFLQSMIVHSMLDNNPIIERCLSIGNEFFRQLGEVLRESIERLAVQVSSLHAIAPGIVACSEGNGHGPSWTELRV